MDIQFSEMKADERSHMGENTVSHKKQNLIQMKLPLWYIFILQLILTIFDQSTCLMLYCILGHIRVGFIFTQFVQNVIA